MNNTSKNKQLYLKVLIGVLVVGLIGTLFFIMNKSKSNNAADIVGSKDGENSNSNTIPANNYFGLDFLGKIKSRKPKKKSGKAQKNSGILFLTECY